MEYNPVTFSLSQSCHNPGIFFKRPPVQDYAGFQAYSVSVSLRIIPMRISLPGTEMSYYIIIFSFGLSLRLGIESLLSDIFIS